MEPEKKRVWGRVRVEPEPDPKTRLLSGNPARKPEIFGLPDSNLTRKPDIFGFLKNF